MAVSIKEEGLLLLDPSPDFVNNATLLQVAENLGLKKEPNVYLNEDDHDATEYDSDIRGNDVGLASESEQQKSKGPPADIELEKLPRPSSALNCRQARSYLVKLLRAANGGQNPQYGNPNSKPPFWPDYYWPWAKLTDVHTKPRGMEEPLLYSEMMKLAIQRGYKYYGYDPETYWDKAVEEKEPSPVERGTPAPILTHQVKNLGLPPKLPRPNSKLNCVQARTVLSKLLRYQQAGNNPVYGHPETKPPWWPDECIRWTDMVDLRGKPPYLPPDMTYTDVLKYAIDKGLKFFGYNCDTWVDSTQYSREINHSLLSKRPLTSGLDSLKDSPPKLPIPINKMNCGLARTTLSRLLRFHCGKNPKYGTLESMPVWWPNDVFDWMALKNLSHRYDGNLGDSYSNCLRLAIVQGYEFYGKDPYTYTEEAGEDLPTVAAIKRIKLTINPQVTAMIDQFDEEIADNPDDVDSNISNKSFDIDDTSHFDDELKSDIEKDDSLLLQVSDLPVIITSKRPPPPLISISDIPDFRWGCPPLTSTPPVKIPRPGGQFGPLLSVRSVRLEPTIKGSLGRCRVDIPRLGLHEVREPIVMLTDDMLSIAKAESDMSLFYSIGKCFEKDQFSDIDLIFSDGVLHAHRLILASSSHLLKELLAEDKTSCLMFPDIGVDEARLAVEALYRGSVVIPRREGMSLARVEQCLRTFQEIGLLTNFSIQIPPSLPLYKIKNTDPPNRLPATSSSPARTSPTPLPSPRPISPLPAKDSISPLPVVPQFEDCTNNNMEMILDIKDAQRVKDDNGNIEPDDNIDLYINKTSSAMDLNQLSAIENIIESHSDPLKLKEKFTQHPDSNCNSFELEETMTEIINIPKEQTAPSCDPTVNSSFQNPLNSSESNGILNLSVITTPKKMSTRKSKGSSSPSKDSLNSNKDVNGQHISGKEARKECTRPKFSEICPESISQFSSKGPTSLVTWLMESGFLSGQAAVCRGCGQMTSLQPSTTNIDGLVWSCPGSPTKCTKGPTSVRDQSIFQYNYKESLTWILRILLCWRENISLTNCHQETGASIDTIFFWYEKCSQFFGLPHDELAE